jgi:uncharacterized protein YbjQ (UPF0145 family)
VIITTTEYVQGYRITKMLGMVKGNTIRARHLGHDIAAVFRNIVGGEIKDYTKMMSETREQALDRMTEDATQLGANAIVSARFATCEMMHGAAELLAYGTAVVIEKE